MENINEMTLPSGFTYFDQKFAEGNDEHFFRGAGSRSDKPLQHHILKSAEELGAKPINVDGAPPFIASGQVSKKTSINSTTNIRNTKYKEITVINKGGDINLIKKSLDKLPKKVLLTLSSKNIKIAATKDSVTEYLTHLKGVKPRGWPPGKTWDNVPGGHTNGVVVIATSGKYPSPTYNLTLHEIGHGYDYAKGYKSKNQSFKNVSSSILPGSKYFSQRGIAGLSEKFAESFSQYYGGYPKVEKKLDDTPYQFFVDRIKKID